LALLNGSLSGKDTGPVQLTELGYVVRLNTVTPRGPGNRVPVTTAEDGGATPVCSHTPNCATRLEP